MPEGAHPVGHQREGHPRAALDLFGKLSRTAAIPACLLLLSACDVGDAATQKIDAPPPKVLEVKVTTSLDEDNRPVRTAVAADGSTVALTTTSFTIRFDRFLLPSTVLRQSVCIQSKIEPVANSAQCQGPGELLLEPVYDPTHREVTYRQAPGGPGLTADTRYQLTVLPPPDNNVIAGGGFRAFDGAPLAESVSFQFMTSATLPMGATLEAAPQGDLFCSNEECESNCATSKKVVACEAACPADCVAACMCDPMAATCENNCPDGDDACDDACDACLGCKPACQAACTAGCATGALETFSSCVFGACHLDNGQVGAAMGLDLSSMPAISMSAISRVAKQTQQGENADEPDRSPVRFGRAMPIIDPFNPGNSYLLYKLAVGKSAIGEAVVSAEEVNRLRGSVVVGMPMPPPPGSAIRDIDMAVLADWIAQGAPTPVCP